MRARNPNPLPAVRTHGARALAGLIAAGLLLGGAASVMLRTAGEWLEPKAAEAGSSDPGSAAARAGGGATAAKVTAVATRSDVAATAAKAGPKALAGQAAKPLATPSSRHPAARAGGPASGGAVVQSPAHLDEQLTYQYNALGRRDPFLSLLGGEYVGSDVGVDAPPDVGGVKVVGIVWGDADQFALVEDARGDSHILRRGDKVMNGFVESLKRDAMIVNLTLDGQSQSITVPLTRKGDKTNANR